MHADGLAIARERIVEEAKARTGFLDLGQLGLTELPEELFTLKHLRRLNLGAGMFVEDGEEWINSSSDIAPNAVEASLERLKELPELRALSVCGCQLADLTVVAGLSALQTLICSYTQVSDLAPLAGRTGLQTLYCGSSQISDLAPLAGLGALQTLDCSDTQVSDLAPLAGLGALRELKCSWTQVSDLAPLAGLGALQSLVCSFTQVSDLAPLAGLSALQTLDCARTQVSDLAPLAGLGALQTLDCSITQVSDLAPLAGLTALRKLHCSSTQVSDLRPLSKIRSLQSLYCFAARQLSDLAPLAALTALQELDCTYTLVSDLAPLASLNCLKRLKCYRLPLIGIPRGLLDLPLLEELVVGGLLPGIPAEVLSASFGDNCLGSLRAHFRDLNEGAIAAANVKLLVLGNGRVGKTQLCRRLRGEAYDETVASTHGVLVTSASLPPATEPAAKLQIWDFGGQDLYHGTHALFMRTNAIFLLVWTPVLEDAQEHVHGGMVFRDHPLAYWVDYVRHLGGRGSPVLVVQTRCDRPEDDAACPVSEADLFDAFPVRKLLRYSARTDRGRAALDEALAEAAAWLGRDGVAVIGAGRRRVQQRLEDMRDADAAVAPEARQYRTITQAHFRRLCDEAGGISSPDHLLAYLHNIGVVFYRPGLFHNEVILDQGWALEAIYAVFHREKSYARIRRQQGRFTRSDLEDWVWRECGYSVEEQELFLSMMQSCGICFEHRRTQDGSEVEYIAPDLLPDRAELGVKLEQVWDADQSSEAATYEYPLLHPGLMRSIVSRIGGEAQVAAEYWKGGVYVYETETKSRALIEEEMIDTCRGRIRVQTQRGQATILLERLRALIEKEQTQAGLTPLQVRTTGDGRTAVATGEVPATGPGREVQASASLSFGAKLSATLYFGQEPASDPEWYVSYAWSDDTPEGKDRAALVDRFCAVQEAKGIQILRDRDVLGLGERISTFMKRIGRAERVFVFVSDKYLKSTFCMFELSEIWRNSRREGDVFLKRVRVHPLACANIYQLEDRMTYSIYWQDRYRNILSRCTEGNYDIFETLGKGGADELYCMKEFCNVCGDILSLIADIRQPRTFEELMKYGLDN